MYLVFYNKNMWWIYFLYAASLASSASLQRNLNLTQTPLPVDDGVDIDETDLKNFKHELDKLSRNYLEAFSSAHSVEEHRRKKRALLSANSTLLSENAEVLRLHAVKPLLSLCSPAIEIKFHDVGDLTYAVCVSESSYSSSVHLGYITRSGWQPLVNWPVEQPQDVALLYDRGLLNILVADRQKVKGIELIKYNVSSREFNMNHIVHSKYPTAVSIWKMKIDGLYHMAVANSEGNNDAEDLSSEIYTYHWMDTYFDKYGSFLAYDVRDIEPFHVHGATYMAVANYRRGKDNYFVDSEIFKYTLDPEGWVSHQKIRTYGALDWEFFSLGTGTGQEFFLAVANYALYDPNVKVGSVIYKYVNDIFVPFQCLQSFGAAAVAAYSHDSKFLLSVAGDDGVSFYQYDGWRFKLASVQYSQLTMSPGVRSLKFQTVFPQEEAVVLAVSNSQSRHAGEYNVYEMSFVEENHLRSWYSKSTEWCLERLSSLQSLPTDTLQELKNVYFVDQKEPITISGNVHIPGFTAAKLSTPRLRDPTSGLLYDSEIVTKMQALSDRLQRASERIEALQQTLNRALRIGGNQSVSGRYEFTDVSFPCEHNMCTFNAINTTILNGEHITELKNNIVLLNENGHITAPLSIENIEAPALTVHGLVDGVYPDSFVTKHGNHQITGHKEFLHPIWADSVDVGGLVDGIPFTAEAIMLTSGHQNITGNLEFADVTTLWLDVQDLVNGVDLKQFYQDVVLVDGTYYISGLKSFSNIIAQNLKMNPGSTINNIDLQSLWDNVLWKNGTQEVVAPMTFSSFDVKKNLVVEGAINGIHIPGNDILMVNQNAQLNTYQEFQGPVTMNNFIVKGAINGIAANPETGELDILKRRGSQTITGEKTFSNIVLMSDSAVHGLVDGIDLSEFQYSAVRNDQPINTDNTWTFNNLVVEGPITSNGYVSGHNIQNIYDRAMKLNESVLPNFQSLVFQDDVTVQNLESNNINGIDIRRDLLLVNEHQVITGEITFQDILLEENSHVDGRVNNISLTFLNNTLLRIGNQMINSKSINGNIKVQNMVVRGSLNGEKVDEIVTTKDDGTIIGNKMLSNVTFAELAVGSLTTNGLVNGINLNSVMEDTLTYEGSQFVTGKKTVRGVLRFPSGSSLLTNNLNGIDLSELYADTVFVDKVQTISGKKYFTAPVSFQDLNADSIDGVTEWDMKYNWMLQDVDQIVASTVSFANIEASDVTVERYVNGINVTRLNETVVRSREPSFVEGPIKFHGTVTSNHDVTLSGKIQGMDLSEEAVLRSKEAVVMGQKTFNESLMVNNLWVDGLIDGIRIEDVCTNVILGSGLKLKTLTVEGDVTIASASVGGTVANVDIRHLSETAYSLQEEAFIDGLKSFDSLTIEGALTVMGKFGGVSIADLSENYMSITRPQVVTAEHVYNELQIDGSLAATNLFTADGLLSGVDVKHLDEKVLRTSGQQSVEAEYNFNEVIFKDDIFVLGKVNGIEIPKGLMRRNRTNYVQSPKIFTQQVIVLGDLDMEDGKTVQGVDVSSWFSRSVKNDGSEYTVNGAKTFANVISADVKVDGLVDGLKISEDSLLLTYGDQVITGKKTIHNDVYIHGGLTVAGLVNGVDVVDLADRVVRRDGNSPIVGVKTFTQPLKIKYLEADLIDGVNISSLQNLVNVDVDYESLKLKLEGMNDDIAEMQGSLENQAVLFQYYELYQTFELPFAYSWLYVPTGNREFLLLSDFTELEKGCTTVRVFEFNPVDSKFHLKQDLVSSKSKAMTTLAAWQYTFVVVTNSVPNLACEYSSDAAVATSNGYDGVFNSIYIYDGESGQFSLHQTVSTPAVVDAVSFFDDIACFVMLDITNAVVHCAYNQSGNFVARETLRTVGGRKASLIQSSEGIILAIASVDLLHYTTQQTVDIYVWDSVQKSFGDPVQQIRTTHAESVLLVSRPGFLGSEIFLLVAEGVVPRVNNAPRIFVFRYENGVFYKFQEIRDSGKLDWLMLPTQEPVFFTLDPRSGRINVYSYKGISGFVRVDSLTSVGTISLHAFTRNDRDDLSHYLALAGPQNAVTSIWEDRDRAKILKSKVKSGRAPTGFY